MKYKIYENIAIGVLFFVTILPAMITIYLNLPMLTIHYISLLIICYNFYYKFKKLKIVNLISCATIYILVVLFVTLLIKFIAGDVYCVGYLLCQGTMMTLDVLKDI